MIEKYDYSYSSQIKRFMEQIVAMFSGFQWKTGLREGIEEYFVVPAIMATTNRQVQHILRNNSENTLLSVPLISIEIVSLETNREMTHAPTGYYQTLQINELEIDKTTDEYGTKQGNKYSLYRPSVHALKITWKVNIWTSNELQKLQLLEQILQTFNVGFDIQNSDNALDQSAKTLCTLENIEYTSRSLPSGSEDIEISSLTFSMPFYLQPPVMVTAQRIIEQIQTNIRHTLEIQKENLDAPDGFSSISTLNSADVTASIFTSPGDHQISIKNNYITLLGKNGSSHDASGNVYSWEKLIETYTSYSLNKSKIMIKYDVDENYSDPETLPEIVGTFQYTTEPNIIYWSIDVSTLPSPTLLDVNAIIDPLVTYPGQGLPFPVIGTRYLVLETISGPTIAWGNSAFSENDIIEFNGTDWIVSFDSSNATTSQIVNVLASSRTLIYNGYWDDLIDKVYPTGFWRLK